MDYERKCKICGKYFITYKRNKFVDSDVCQKEYNRVYMRELMRKKRADEKIVYNLTCTICKQPYQASKLKSDPVCFKCKLNKRKIFERDYALKANAEELKATPLTYIQPEVKAECL